MSEDTSDIEAMRRDLEDLVCGEENGMIRLPPGAKTDDGEDVGGRWAFATLVPPYFVRYHFGYKKQLERKLKATTVQNPSR